MAGFVPAFFVQKYETDSCLHEGDRIFHCSMRYPFLIAAIICAFAAELALGQERQQLNSRRPRYVYVQRHLSREGDEKVVTVPGINARQAMLDAQTYNIGWDAVGAWVGQTRVMYNVLLRKRAAYERGTLPVPHPVPGEKKLPRRR